MLSITLILITLGTLKFISWYRPRSIDYFITFPYTLVLRKSKDNNGLEQEYSDDLLNRLTKEMKEIDPKVKMFNMRVNINMADVVDYAEWTTSTYEDEKTFSNAVCVRFIDNTEMILNVEYDQFDLHFTDYLKQVYR